MKKIIFILLMLVSLNAISQETYREGEHELIYTTVDGKVQGITIDGREISSEENRSAAMCALDKKVWCCSHPAQCPTCCNNAACEISWYLSCLFGWLSKADNGIKNPSTGFIAKEQKGKIITPLP